MKKRLLSSLLALCMMLSLLPATVWAAEDGGTPYTKGATPGGTYTISTAQELHALAETVNGGESYADTTFKLTQDIDLSSVCSEKSDISWTPVGTAIKQFNATVDGGRHTITGLYINFTDDYQGLFGYVGSSGVVKNLSVDGTVSGGNFVGGIVGYNQGTVENCYNTAAVTGSGDNIGGVVGYNQGTVSNCYNTGTVTGAEGSGGGDPSPDDPPPSFTPGYPKFYNNERAGSSIYDGEGTTLVGDTFASLQVNLSKAGMVHYVVASRYTITPRLANNPEASDAEKWTAIPTDGVSGSPPALSAPTPTAIAGHTYPSAQYPQGTVAYTAAGSTLSIDVNGLQPNTDYYVYFVLEAQSSGAAPGQYSDVLIYKFRTSKTTKPKITLTDSGQGTVFISTAGVGDSVAADLNWIVFPQVTERSALSEAFAIPQVDDNGHQIRGYRTEITTILQALTTVYNASKAYGGTVPDNAAYGAEYDGFTVFDVFANEAQKVNVDRLINGADLLDGAVNRGTAATRPDTQYTANVNWAAVGGNVNLSPDVVYLILVSGHNTDSGTGADAWWSVNSFAAWDHLVLQDHTPPQLMNYSGSIGINNVDAVNGGELSGSIYLTFDKDVYWSYNGVYYKVIGGDSEPGDNGNGPEVGILYGLQSYTGRITATGSSPNYLISFDGITADTTQLFLLPDGYIANRSGVMANDTISITISKGAKSANTDGTLMYTPYITISFQNNSGTITGTSASITPASESPGPSSMTSRYKGLSSGGGTVKVLAADGGVSGNIGGVVGCNDGGTVRNCYYLNTATGKGIGNGSDSETLAISKTAQQFASGEVAWLLRSKAAADSGGKIWGQKIKADNTPVLDPDKTVYKVTLNYNYADAPSGVSAYVNADLETVAEPERMGYEFLGWYKEPEGTTEYSSAPGDMTIYAKWTADTPTTPTTYTVTFDSQGGSEVPDQSVAEGGKVTKPVDPTRNGYGFGGWYKDPACTSAWDFGEDTVTGELKLYAKWTAYSVELVVKDEKTPDVKVNGLEEIAAAQAGEGEEDAKITVTFTVEAVTDPTDKADIEKVVTGDRDNVLYLDMTLTRTVVPGSGNSTQSKITDTGGAVLEIAVPYDFQGKKDVTVHRGHDGKVEKLTLAQSSESKRDGVFRLDQENGFVFIYAGKFSTYAISYTAESEQTAYTVTFNSQGGSAVTAQTVVNGGKVTKPADPARSGYSFGGWFKEATCTNKWNFDTDTVIGDITLYAKWTADTPETGTPDDKTDTYAIRIDPRIWDGEVYTSHTYAEPGTTVTITVYPDTDYIVDWVDVERNDTGRYLSVSQSGRRYTFTMPASDVTVYASFSLDIDEYEVWVAPGIQHGKVSISRTFAEPGTRVTITVTPDSYYALDWIRAERWDNGRSISLSQSGSRYTFTMPYSDVVIDAGFALQMTYSTTTSSQSQTIYDAIRPVTAPTTTQATTQTQTSTPAYTLPATTRFSDVLPGAYYYEAVTWTVGNGITSGYSDGTFRPEATCSRADFVTYLWHAGFSRTASSRINPFIDVSPNAYYYEAVLWALENGVTSGSSANTFDPDGTCTRAQIITFLWRAHGRPAVGNGTVFSDVPSGSYYADAVAWAAAKGIASGTTATTFEPDRICTRGECVTFMYRVLTDQ